MSHTRGPWKPTEYRKQSESDAGELAIGVETDYPPGPCSGNRSIAFMTGGYLTREDRPEPERNKIIAENRANAKLMASSEHLLEALRAVADYFGDSDPKRYPIVAAVRAAIAKATD